MPLQNPTPDDIETFAEQFHLDLSEEELQTYTTLITESLGAYETIDSYDHSRSSYRHQSASRVTRPPLSDDDLNAWISRCRVDADTDGSLAGWDVALKDNVSLAGIEMTCGSDVLSGYVPDVDATIVRRLLDAGARIIGKTNMDSMAFTGNGHSSDFGPTRNPYDPAHLAGGSSGGSAIAVATGEADLAIGSDQGGSIRAPASWSGVVGHKPTHGLVPYTGMVGIENTVDHAGPITRSVADAATALTALAGPDSDDPRQPSPDKFPDREYEAILSDDVTDLQIGVVDEGFERPEGEEIVDEINHTVLDRLADNGATVESVSIPMHADANDIYTVSLSEGTVASIRGEGIGHNWNGWYNTSWIEAFGKFRRAHGDAFPPSLILILLAGAYASEAAHSAYYGKAMNLRADLRAQYDNALGTYDVLAMPTTPQTANKYVPDQDIPEFIADAWGNLVNTSAFNMTGHPAISVPAGMAPSDEIAADHDLPIGIMFVSNHFEDETVLRAAAAVEQVRDSIPSP